MEPWLDSLSEDWKSEHRSSSPAPSLSSSRQQGSIASRSSSRIPHLANNIRKNSTTGSFLRHRSSYGKARQTNHSILRERSASNLNLPPASGSQKHSSLPRRTSNAFSESQNSVQHHSVREKSTLAETPEWKKRLAVGEELNSDGFDLFSPSKLEGVFKQPNSSQLHSDKDVEPADTSFNRKPFALPTSNPFPEQYSSYRGTARGRPNLEVLEEVNEEEESEQQKFSALSSDIAKNGSLRGLVKQRIQSFERVDGTHSGPSSPRELSDSVVQDHRYNTSSGLEELRNEYISPVTMSKQNSIRNTIMRNPLDEDMEALQDKLRQAASDDVERPSSSASDSFVDYARNEDAEILLHDEPLPDLTSQSLPDDLTMGTQIFETHGGFINSRRGGRSNEASFLRKSLSLSQEPSHLETTTRPIIQINSSPPLPACRFDESIDQSRISASAPTTPPDTSVIHYTDNQLRPTSSGSPLKLFGNRDTYTNNKLMRILSHFEEPDNSRGKVEEEELPEEAQDQAFRMSQFGQGELDAFGFEQNVRKPSPIHTAVVKPEDKIFKALASIVAKNKVIQSSSDAQEHSQIAAESLLGEKDRTTKRRKTLFKDQISLLDHEIEVKITELDEKASLAGKKRKDARPGDEGFPAEPDVLADRDLLRPRSSRRSSANRVVADAGEDNAPEVPDPVNEDLTEALAAELATFAQEAAQVHNDSRKPSLATKDYMEEANKVMQFIRSRGKPKPAVAIPEASEPVDVSDFDPDSILDLTVDGESTKDSFSRPPSRDHTPKPAVDRRNARHDSRTANYLRKYRDEDDMDALGGTTSVFGTVTTTVRQPEPIPEAAEDESQESSPPNIRILSRSETLRKRKYSSSTIEQGVTLYQMDNHHSIDGSAQNSYPTNSSSSGHKGVISSGTVTIPDHVGIMTFDYEKQIWVKKIAEDGGFKSRSRQRHQTSTEDDPFDDIPDLSIDEKQELHAKAHAAKAATFPNEVSIDNTAQAAKSASFQPQQEPLADSERQEHLSEDEDDTVEIDRSSIRSKASEHEAKLHNGIASAPPTPLKDDRRQARVVTIAFSSPLVSGVNYANLSEEDFSGLPREEDLPLDESEIHFEEIEEQSVQQRASSKPTFAHSKSNALPATDNAQMMAFQPRTISPIVEDDEDHFDPQMSLVHVKHSKVVTPAPNKSIAKLQKNGEKASSILCLTPLSDFSVHQIDAAKDPDQSYVEERKHPNALRQAHGSLALAVDELVKAITDAVPDELFWDQLSQLNLAPSSVKSLHGLKEYCPLLEELTLSGNRVSQLGGLPKTLRILDIHDSMVNDLTSWGHLQNLQYLDVSGCQLENLEGFSSLVHLRSLKAKNNKISNIDGILDLNGLLELDLSGNEITNVDLEGCDLERLKKLAMSHNQLQSIKNLNCLPALEELDLCHNFLKTFSPSSVNQDVPLRKLQITHNELEVIGLKNMPALQHLTLDNNKIQDIHGLSSAYHLEFLSLREQSGRSDIVEQVLTTPNECRHIRLSANAVVNGTFRLPRLPQNNVRELELAACGISELPERFGLYFPNCRYLNANFNAIKEVAPLRKMVHLKPYSSPRIASRSSGEHVLSCPGFQH